MDFSGESYSVVSYFSKVFPRATLGFRFRALSTFMDVSVRKTGVDARRFRIACAYLKASP